MSERAKRASGRGTLRSMLNIGGAAAVAGPPGALAVGIGSMMGGSKPASSSSASSSSVEEDEIKTSIEEDARRKREQKMIDKSKTSMEEISQKGCGTLITNLGDIAPEIGVVLTQVTGIPANDRDLLANLETLQSKFKDATLSGDVKLALRLSSQLQRATLDITDQLLERSQTRDTNAAFFMASEAASAHPNDAKKQFESIVEGVKKSEPDMSKEIDGVKQNIASRDTQTALGDVKKETGDLDKEGRFKKMAKILAKCFIFSIKLASDVLVKFVRPSGLAGIAVTAFSSPFVGLQAAGATYCFTGDRNFALSSTNGIFNILGCVSLALGMVRFYRYAEQSRTAAFFAKYISSEKSFVQKLEVFVDVVEGLRAIGQDISGMLPAFDDMFAVQVLRGNHKFITPFRTALEIVKDISNGTSVDGVNIVWYAWKNGLSAYNVTKALNNRVFSPEESLLENVQKVGQQIAADSLVSVLSNAVNNEQMNNALANAAENLVISLAEKHGEQIQERLLAVAMNDVLPKIAAKVEQQLPAMAIKMARTLVESPEIKEKLLEVAGENVQQISDNMVGALANSLADTLYQNTFDNPSQLQLDDQTFSNSEKLHRSLFSLADKGLEYVATHPGIIMDAATRVVSVASPILEGGIAASVSKGFGKASAEGYVNTALLGAVKGAFDVGLEYAESITEKAAYVGGRAATNAVSNVAANVRDTVTDPATYLTAAAAYAGVPIEQAYVGARVAAHAAGKVFSIGKRRSASRVKKSAKKIKKSVSMNMKNKKKSVKRSAKRSSKRSPKNKKKSVKRSSKRSVKNKKKSVKQSKKTFNKI